MTIEHAKQLLLDKERSLVQDLDRLRGAIAGPEDVGDPVDAGTSAESEGEAGVEISQATETLEAVRAALQRIEDGTYGRCIICGRPIETKRLEAVPWTPYCLEHQEKIDSERGLSRGATL
ncbi:MAG TPA: TraR/DksA C4-type zinc finger protein [Bryobacteraceae bacterium]|jgi:DnaK suppressor protein|nr:TraR/DksA C4-type zinc finger protein [Bryobacteraceae bacterium]